MTREDADWWRTTARAIAAARPSNEVAEPEQPRCPSCGASLPDPRHPVSNTLLAAGKLTRYSKPPIGSTPEENDDDQYERTVRVSPDYL